MRKYFAVFVVCFLYMTQAVYAHPPSKIEVTFDKTTKILTATIFHPVENPQSHYITKVDVGLNGKEVIEHEISQQDNDTIQSVSYLIPDAKLGDVLSIEAYCNINGTKTESINVE